MGCLLRLCKTGGCSCQNLTADPSCFVLQFFSLVSWLLTFERFDPAIESRCYHRRRLSFEHRVFRVAGFPSGTRQAGSIGMARCCSAAHKINADVRLWRRRGPVGFCSSSILAAECVNYSAECRPTLVIQSPSRSRLSVLESRLFQGQPRHSLTQHRGSTRLPQKFYSLPCRGNFLFLLNHRTRMNRWKVQANGAGFLLHAAVTLVWALEFGDRWTFSRDGYACSETTRPLCVFS